MLFFNFIAIAVLTFTSVKGFSQSKDSIYAIDDVLSISMGSANGIRLNANVKYPTQCFEPLSLKATLDETNKVILLSHHVRIYDFVCNQFINNRLISTDLEMISEGAFKVVDELTGRIFGVLVVNEEFLDYFPASLNLENPIINK